MLQFGLIQRSLWYGLMMLCMVLWVGQTHAQKTPQASEQMRFRAQEQRDLRTLEDLLADDLIYIHSNALVESKSDFLSSVEKGAIRYERMRPAPDQRIRRFGKTAIINGTVEVDGIYKGTPFSVTLLYTSVYRRRGGTWRLLRWQSTSKRE